MGGGGTRTSREFEGKGARQRRAEILGEKEAKAAAATTTYAAKSGRFELTGIIRGRPERRRLTFSASTLDKRWAYVLDSVMVEAANYPAKLGSNSASTDAPAVLGDSLIDSPPDSAFEPIDRSVSPADDAPPEPPAFASSSTERGGTTDGVPFSFGPPPPAPCSVSRCAAGHEWIPQLRIASCPGCGAPMLVLLMQNCPACNEPTAATDLRLDHMPAASGQLMPICRGGATLAEPLRIELRHSHAEDEEKRHVVREVVSKV